jgi:hypothetical protein
VPVFMAVPVTVPVAVPVALVEVAVVAEGRDDAMAAFCADAPTPVGGMPGDDDGRDSGLATFALPPFTPALAEAPPGADEAAAAAAAALAAAKTRCGRRAGDDSLSCSGCRKCDSVESEGGPLTADLLTLPMCQETGAKYKLVI